MFLIHLFACPCGSIMSGHRFELLKNTVDVQEKAVHWISTYLWIIPFSTEKASLGRPAIFHARMTTGSPSVPTRENDAERGRFLSSINLFHSLIISYASYTVRDLPVTTSGTHLTENGCERAQIGNDTAGQKNITDEVVVLMREIFRCLHPTSLLSSESTDQSFGTIQFRFTIHDLRIRDVRWHWERDNRLICTCLDSSSFFARFSSSCRCRTASFSCTDRRCARFTVRISSAFDTWSSAAARASFFGATILATTSYLSMAIVHLARPAQACETVSTFSGWKFGSGTYFSRIFFISWGGISSRL